MKGSKTCRQPQEVTSVPCNKWPIPIICLRQKETQVRDCNNKKTTLTRSVCTQNEQYFQRGQAVFQLKACQGIFPIKYFFHQKITKILAFHLRVCGTILIKTLKMGSRRMMKEQSPMVASHPAAGRWAWRARFKAKVPSGALSLLTWTSTSHKQEETALAVTQPCVTRDMSYQPYVHTQDTSLSSGQPTHLELCTVLSCAVFTRNEAEMGKAGFGPAVVAGTNSHLTAKAFLGWGFLLWLMLLQSLAQNKPPITLQEKEPGLVFPCTLMRGQNMCEWVTAKSEMSRDSWAGSATEAYTE